MPKQLPADLLERVRAELAAFPDGGAIEDLSARLTDLVSRRSLLDTERLIHAGQEAAGKNAEETQMILNHRAAIELLVNSDHQRRQETHAGRDS